MEKQYQGAVSTAGAANAEHLFPELDHVIDAFFNKQASLITILQEAQAAYGYLSEDVMRYISRRTDIGQASVYGVATFYAQFRLAPIGKYLIMLCKGTACHVSGSDTIGQALYEKLGIRDGETTEDGLFTLQYVACLGCCSLAPVMMVETSDGKETYGNMTGEEVTTIINDLMAREGINRKEKEADA